MIQCRNNLHQIGLATHNFHATYGRLPGSVPTSKTPLRELLPQVEANALAEWFHTVPPPLIMPEGPSVYICPSDPLASTAKRNMSYLMNGGSAIYPPNGIASYRNRDSPRSFRDVTDGLSSTAMFAEKLVLIPPTPDQHLSGYPIDLAPGAFAPCLEDGRRIPPGQERELADYTMEDTNRQTAQLGIPFGMDNLVTGGAWYNHLVPPGNWTFANADLPERGPSAATSLHSSGVHVLMADGAVKFVSSNIDLMVWWAVGSIASGENVTDF